MKAEVENAVIGAVVTALVSLLGGCIVKQFLKRQLKATKDRFAADIELMNIAYQNLVCNERLPAGWEKECQIDLPSLLDMRDFIDKYKLCRWYWRRQNRLALDATEKYLIKMSDLQEKLLSESDDRQARLDYQKLMRFWVYCYAQMNNIGQMGSAQSSLSTKLFIPAQLVKYKLETDPNKAFRNYCIRTDKRIIEGEEATNLIRALASREDM